jgi:hypothetical protein
MLLRNGMPASSSEGKQSVGDQCSERERLYLYYSSGLIDPDHLSACPLKSLLTLGFWLLTPVH